MSLDDLWWEDDPEFLRIREALLRNHDEGETLMRELNERFPPARESLRWERSSLEGVPGLHRRTPLGDPDIFPY